jgi:hypothetical protein
VGVDAAMQPVRAAIRCSAAIEGSVDSHNADKDETALAVLALLACVAHGLERGDFVN